MRFLAISDGAMCMDGGSIYLEATDEAGRPWQISLDWSIDAQRDGKTNISINGTRLQAGGAEEAEWIESLRSAEIGGEDASEAPPPPRKLFVLAPDAKAYLATIDKGPRSALLALRDDLVQKLQSPNHRQQLPAFRRSGPLPLP